MRVLENIADLVSKKVIGNVSVVSLMISIALSGIFSLFFGFYQSAAFTLIAFGIIGFTEVSFRNAKTRFSQGMKKFNAITSDDSEAFLKFSDNVFGVRGWKAETEDIAVGGLVFRRFTTDKPSPFQTISGPLCPECKKLLECRMVSIFPWAIRFGCLCGFRSTKLTHPEKIYKRIRNHYNFPI
jgi:hypothetical protein